MQTSEKQVKLILHRLVGTYYWLSSAFLDVAILQLYGFIAEPVKDGQITFYSGVDRSKVSSWQRLSPVVLSCENRFVRLAVCFELEFAKIAFFHQQDIYIPMSRLFTSTVLNSWRTPNCRLIRGSRVTLIRCNTSMFGSQTQAWSYVKQQTLDEASSKVCLIFNFL